VCAARGFCAFYLSATIVDDVIFHVQSSQKEWLKALIKCCFPLCHLINHTCNMHAGSQAGRQHDGIHVNSAFRAIIILLLNNLQCYYHRQEGLKSEENAHLCINSGFGVLPASKTQRKGRFVVCGGK